MIDVAHHGDNWRARHEFGWIVRLLILSEKSLLGRLRFANFQLTAGILGHQLSHIGLKQGVNIDRAERQSEGHQLLHHLGHCKTDCLGQTTHANRHINDDFAFAGLRARLTAQPARIPPVSRSLIYVAAGALALTVLFVLVLSRWPQARPPALDLPPNELMVASFDGSLPTVWSLHRAVVDPSVELDQLLDQHRGFSAAVPVEPPPRFSVSSFQTQLQMGEL